MASIITDKFRLDVARMFREDLNDSANSHYAFFGKASDWTNEPNADDIVDTLGSDYTARQDMLGMKLIDPTNDVRYALPRKQWTSGTIYGQYTYNENLDDVDYVVITNTFKVYMCLKTGLSATGTPIASSVEPTHTDSNVPEPNETDGYIWKYLYTLSASDANKFASSAYIPVKTLESQPSVGDTYLSQWDVQQYARRGAIHRIDVTNGGSGYTLDTISVSVKGDFVDECTVVSANDIVLDDNGAVTEIKVQAANIGSGYKTATVVISDSGSGVGATAEAMIAPPEGFGADPVSDTNAHFVAFNIEFDQSGEGKFPVGIDYRQIGIIKNPTLTADDSIATAEYISPLKSITYTGDDPTSAFTAGDVITNGAGTAEAIVVDYDAVNKTIRFYQNETTGFVEFADGDTISSGSKSVTGTTINDATINKESGRIIFLENRSYITRSTENTETVKLVLEF